MPDTLAQLWKDKPAFLSGKSFRQIIQMAGDGRLRDGNKTSAELREWLRTIELEHVRRCAEECLSPGFDESGHALQDVVNEIGLRLGFQVIHGRYRGVKNDIGNDGLWVGEDEYKFLVEVKTTDTYRINLDTIAAYRKALVARGDITEEKSSILIAVGRQDTGDLEAQIRGSSHAWEIRLISVDALLRLADVKQQLNDWTTSKKINQLLRPVEYTRLDGIVELLFAAKQDLEAAEVIPPVLAEEKTVAVSKLDSSELEQARESGVQRVETRIGAKLIRRGKALRSTSDGTSRVVCLVSQRYQGASPIANYWYGFTPAQRAFIESAKEGWLALVCGDTGSTFLLPREKVIDWLPDVWTTPAEPSSTDDIRHWHFYLADNGHHIGLSRYGGGELVDLTPYHLH